MELRRTEEARADARGADVVIVDDDKDTREIVACVLESNGYQVSTAPTGQQALDTLVGMPVPPRLVLLDLLMPGMSGDEVIHEMKRRGSLADVPIVLFSGVSDLSRRAGQLPVEAWLPKPGNLDELLDLVERFVG